MNPRYIVGFVLGLLVCCMIVVALDLRDRIPCAETCERERMIIVGVVGDRCFCRPREVPPPRPLAVEVRP